MTFDGFNAAVLIEPASTASLILQPNLAEGPTLQDALSAKDDALPPDLWHVRTGEPRSSSMATPVRTSSDP